MQNFKGESINNSHYVVWEIVLGLVTFIPGIWAIAHNENVDQTSYESGKVVKVNSNQLVMKTNNHRDIVLHLSPKTFVWKPLEAGNNPVKVDDTVRAVGAREADGSVNVTQLFVNMVMLIGPITSIKQEAGGFQLSLQDRSLGSVLVLTGQQTVTRQTLGGGSSELHEGQLIRVTGYRLKDGSVLAKQLLF